MFSGLSPQIVAVQTATSTNGAKIAVCKFPQTMTVTDTYLIFETGATTQTTTTYGLVRGLNGGTTGNVTTRIWSKGGASGGAFTPMTGRNVVTNYTMSANQWLVLRYSEQGTVAAGNWNCTVIAVAGNV